MSELYSQMPAYYLHAAGELAATPEIPTDLPAQVNGQPAAYFWADGIRAGAYVHPTRAFELRVDEARMDGWVRNFHRMRENGVDVPVPVDHSASARDNLGYVIDVRREGDTLKLLHQLIGEDAIRLASRNKVSLGIDPAFKDGLGRAYGDCVVHSSLTPLPVVPGQVGFVPMGPAPNDAESPPVLVLARSDPGSAIEQAELARRLAEAERRAEQAEARVLELSRPAPVAIPAELLAGYTELYGRQADALVQSGRITPACRDRLQALLRPVDVGGLAALPLMLSRGPSPGNGDRNMLDVLFSALEQNRALDAGERTGVQILSRAVPGDDTSLNPVLQHRMVQMANGK